MRSSLDHVYLPAHATSWVGTHNLCVHNLGAEHVWSAIKRVHIVSSCQSKCSDPGGSAAALIVGVVSGAPRDGFGPSSALSHVLQHLRLGSRSLLQGFFHPEWEPDVDVVQFWGGGYHLFIKVGDMEDMPSISPAYEKLVTVMTHAEKQEVCRKSKLWLLSGHWLVSGQPRWQLESSTAPCQHWCPWRETIYQAPKTKIKPPSLMPHCLLLASSVMLSVWPSRGSRRLNENHQTSEGLSPALSRDTPEVSLENFIPLEDFFLAA